MKLEYNGTSQLIMALCCMDYISLACIDAQYMLRLLFQF